MFRINVGRDPKVHVTAVQSCRQSEAFMYATISFAAQFITLLATVNMGVSFSLRNIPARLKMVRSYGNA